MAAMAESILAAGSEGLDGARSWGAGNLAWEAIEHSDILVRVSPPPYSSGLTGARGHVWLFYM